MDRLAKSVTGRRGDGRGRLAPWALLAALLSLPAPPLAAQDARPGTGMFGTTALIDMPTAHVQPDGEITTTLSYFPGTTRGTLSFQIAPRLSGSFRYSEIDPWTSDGGRLLDRSFDLHFQLMEQGRYMPALAVGLRDFLGTGVYSGEYVVASRRITPRLGVTGGIGWGRLGSHNGFTNPLGALDERFETRPGGTAGEGGVPRSDDFFRGDAAFFGGISYQLNDRLELVAEYSSDAYARETAVNPDFEHRSPLNFGARYQLSDAVSLGGYYLHGSVVGAQMTIALNPARRDPPMSFGDAPPPVLVRPAPETAGSAWSQGWAEERETRRGLADDLARVLDAQGIDMLGLDLAPRRAILRFHNRRFDAEAQALGRIARVMSRQLPASVEEFVLVPVENGMALSRVSLQRSDLEAQEHAFDGTETVFRRLSFGDAHGLGAAEIRPARDGARFSWALTPYVRASLFDPDNPFRLDSGLRLRGSYDIAPNLTVSGAVRQSIAGNFDTITRERDSPLPRVRSDFPEYYREGATALEHLTLEHFARPGPDLYSRLTLGYLEEMYAGVSGELLWRPVDSALGLGVELNYAWQRDFDQGLGLRDYEVATGHVSAYYDFAEGYNARLDLGRYLAGDWGGTLALEREFENGWRIGAFATLTDVSYDDFGEGSFDKGLTVTIPLSWVLGQPTRDDLSSTLRPVTGDGGARLEIRNRLDDVVRDYHRDSTYGDRGRFWQ